MKQETETNVASVLSPEHIGKPLSSKAIGVAADAAKSLEAQAKNFGAIGQAMATAYLDNVGKATVTWHTGILSLLKTANNIQRELAMKGCIEVAAANSDEGAVVSLRKRVSETRRVFKAADADYKGTLAIMEGKGNWHAKIGKLPKGNAGRPASTPSTATTGTSADAGNAPSASDKGDVLKAHLYAEDIKAGKVKSVPLDVVSAGIRMQKPENLLKCLDVVAFQLANLPKAPNGKTDPYLMMRSLGSAVMKLRDTQDNAQLMAEARQAATA